MAAPVPNIVPLPVPNLGQDPQPNIGNLQQLIHDVANEVALFQNAPALPAIHNILQQMQQQQAAVLQQLQLLTNSVNITQASIALIPMQLFNATASSEAPLMLPPGIANPPFPLTKNNLLELSAVNCTVTQGLLGLPPFAAGLTLIQRRQIIMDHLGCGMRA